MRLIFTLFVSVVAAFDAFAQDAEKAAIRLSATACEELLAGESRAGAQIRAADKASFNSVKKLNQLTQATSELNDHDVNILVYRLVDEYVEDLSVATLPDENAKVCVQIEGWLKPIDIKRVVEDFYAEKSKTSVTPFELMEEIADESVREISLEPKNPQELSLVYIGDVVFFNGATFPKLSDYLKNMYADNPYFYLTDDAEIADYVIRPKVITAKVDMTEQGQKRLHMVVVLETMARGVLFAEQSQNRFVLFDASENQQNIANQMLQKLMEQAGRALLSKIEHNESQRLEQKALGRELSS